MLWNIDTGWLLMAVATVAVLSFFFGAAIDALMRQDSFGMMGNGTLICGGFFLGIYLANLQGYNLRELHLAIIVGVVGGFVLLFSATFVKAMVMRMSA